MTPEEMQLLKPRVQTMVTGILERISNWEDKDEPGCGQRENVAEDVIKLLCELDPYITMYGKSAVMEALGDGLEKVIATLKKLPLECEVSSNGMEAIIMILRYLADYYVGYDLVREKLGNPSFGPVVVNTQAEEEDKDNE